MEDVSKGMVSVVMGCFNADPEHLREALDSALEQDYEPLEVVLVDDGSTRGDTLAVMDEYAGRVRVLHQGNAGVAAARNAGVAAAAGEFIQVLDSDDRMDPTLVREGVETFADPGVVLAYSSARVFGGENRDFLAGKEYRLADIIDVNHITICAMLRRSRWLEVGGQHEALRDGYEDYEFWVRVLRDGGVARRTPSARFHYRVRPGSRSDEITAGAMARTRAVMLETNVGHLPALMQAAFTRMDALEQEKRDYVGYVRQWQRRTRPLIAVRDGLRRLAGRR